MSADRHPWKSYFTATDRAGFWRCNACGETMSARGGRATNHLKRDHGIDPGGASPSPEGAPESEAGDFGSSITAPPGTPEWAIQVLVNSVSKGQNNPREVTPPMKLLAEILKYGSATRFDDEEDHRKHMEMWERQIAKGRDIEESIKRMLRDPTARNNIIRWAEEVERA